MSLASVVVPSTYPCFARPIAPDLVSLSIELDRWPLWAGQSVGAPNTFTNQVLQNLADRTGRPPSLRIGGDSEDRSFYDPSVAGGVSQSTFPPAAAVVPYPEATVDELGPDFYRLSGNIIDGTHFVWGVNLESGNVTNTALQVESLYDTFYGKHAIQGRPLDFLEIGNEPDRYATASTPAAYVAAWTAASNAVLERVSLADYPTRIQIGAYANYSLGNPWTVQATLGADILASPAGSQVSRFVKHMYAGAFGYGPPPSSGDLMNKAAVRGNLTTQAAQAPFALQAGLTYALGETNSFANHGAPNVSNAGEAAVWIVDFALQAATLNVERAYFHNGIGYAYNLFQPVALNSSSSGGSTPAHVQPAYYGALAVYEAIGKDGCTVAEFSVNSTHVAGYGIYTKQHELARVVLINSAVAPSDGSGRNSTSVHLPGASGSRVKRLAIPSTRALSGLTWGGQSFDTPDGKAQGKEVWEKVSGDVVETVASEVVVVEMK